MIEIIYDKEADAKSQTKENREQSLPQMKLPKNIRQIGSPEGHKRIYIEDYVVTYLNYIARPGSIQARGAVLFGESKKSDQGDVIFISGAVDAQNIEFDMDESEFTQEVWKEIYEQAKLFFPGLSVVGWFLSRMGFSTAINEKIERLHVENFPGRDKVLFVTDSLESEDAFYIYEHGQLVKQKGYYIYYDRNEAMQNYIMKKKGEEAPEPSEIQRKDEEIIKQFRRKNSTLHEQKETGISFVYVASSFVVLALLAMGITVVSNYDKMKEMEVSINRLEITADATEEYVEALATTGQDLTESPATWLDVEQEDADETDIEDPMNQDIPSEEVPDTEETMDIVDTTSEQDIQSQSEETTLSTTETTQAVMVMEDTTYIVQEGDSLSSIAFAFYKDADKAWMIAEKNGIDVEGNIYVGQKIILPKE